MNDLSTWRIILLLICCLALVFLVRNLGQSFQYRWWVHSNNKRRAHRKLQHWSCIRAGETEPHTSFERSLTVMSEHQFMKEIRNMLWDNGLYEQGRAMWGDYTRARPFATIPVKWDDGTREDKVVYNQRKPIVEAPPPTASKNEPLTVNQ